MIPSSRLGWHVSLAQMLLSMTPFITKTLSLTARRERCKEENVKIAAHCLVPRSIGGNANAIHVERSLLV